MQIGMTVLGAFFVAIGVFKFVGHCVIFHAMVVGGMKHIPEMSYARLPILIPALQVTIGVALILLAVR